MMLRAIQIHPHDVRDEGAECVVKNIVDIAGIKLISPEVSTLEERHPYPRGELPHNPVHKVVTTSATMEIPPAVLNFRTARKLPFSPQFSERAASGGDYIGELSDAAAKHGVEIVPWVKALNAAFEGDIERYCVVTAEGELVKTWLCPRREESFFYVLNLIEAMRLGYGAKTILLDRVRYPDWSGKTVSIDRMITCFCPECVKAMNEQGINTTRLRLELKHLKDGAGGNGALISAWLECRRNTISEFVRRLREEINKRGLVKLWLNLWSPSFAKFLGQDYDALGRLCDGAKHFPYHKLGGGADLKGLIEHAEPNADNREKLFSALLRLMDIPDISFDKFVNSGFPASFVRRETAIAKKLFGGTPIFSGIQIWDVPAEDIGEACREAILGGADGFYFYCYGWAGLESLRECATA